MKYHFNFKLQLIIGILNFVLSFLILYLFTKETNWITPAITGITTFVIWGFYPQVGKCKK